MAYRIEYLPRVLREVCALPTRMQDRIRDATAALTADPRPYGCRKLSGERDLWRIRVGDYRVVYRIDDALRVVSVLRIGHRSDVYR